MHTSAFAYVCMKYHMHKRTVRGKDTFYYSY